MMRKIIFSLLFAAALRAAAQSRSAVWCPDRGDGTYINPVINADYSDPDAIGVDGQFYLTASSFNCAPGLPILHSADLVNWEIIGHALRRVEPDSLFRRVQHGKGVFAPSLRYHDGMFYIYWGDPDQGVFMVKAHDARGPWSEPLMVIRQRGIIDTTPLWDDDGRCYLINAWAGSRVKFGSVLTVRELSPDGTRAISDPVIVFDGSFTGDRVVEGPKLYKYDGYYYIFAPAGGVGHGWQIALRSKNIYGPYERREVLRQGSTDINGPHQGAWVRTTEGEDWFLHFQNHGAFGRIIHLQPMTWKDGWPVIGDNGEPVREHKKPRGLNSVIVNPRENDEFDTPSLALQWQWPSNYQDDYGMPTSYGVFRLYSHQMGKEEANMWLVPNMLLQKLPSDNFTATARVTFAAKDDGQQGGIIMMGGNYSALVVRYKGGVFQLIQLSCEKAGGGTPETADVIAALPPTRADKAPSSRVYEDIFLRLMVSPNQRCSFAYSLDGDHFTPCGVESRMAPGVWIGSKMGFVCTSSTESSMKCWLDIDWFRVTKK